MSLQNHLQNLNNPELGVHHHDVLVVRETDLLSVDWLSIGETVGHHQASAQNHLSHHLTHTMDGTHDIITYTNTA